MLVFFLAKDKFVTVFNNVSWVGHMMLLDVPVKVFSRMEHPQWFAYPIRNTTNSMTSREKQLLKQNMRADHTKCRFLVLLELIHLAIPQFTPFSPPCLSSFESNFQNCLPSA